MIAMMVRKRAWTLAVRLLASSALLGLLIATPDFTSFTPAAAQVADPVVDLPLAHCQPGDLTETGLQGQVPRTDRADGRAAQGYNCNLRLLSSYSRLPYDPAEQNP